MHPGNVTVSRFSPTYAPSHPQTSKNEKEEFEGKKSKTLTFWTYVFFAINIFLDLYLCQKLTGSRSNITKLGVSSQNVDQLNIINKSSPFQGIVDEM